MGSCSLDDVEDRSSGGGGAVFVPDQPFVYEWLTGTVDR
jgi:hypothetical protein